MEFFVWVMVITLLLSVLLIPLAMAVGGLALLVSAIHKIFSKRI
jgi:hypothetical protein